MKVLVTGGAGFIGSHLVERLLASGADVRVLDNLCTGHRSNLAAVVGDVELIEGDVQSSERVRRAVRGCEVVLHEAALPSVPRSIVDPLTTHAANVTGTLNVLLAARDEGVRRLVLASSSSVYGTAGEPPWRESDPALPISPYAAAKLAAESYCRSFTVVYGLETVALRYFNVFGPRQDLLSAYAAVVPKFIAAYQADEAPVIFGDGQQSRDFTYVENVVDANFAALDAPGVAGRVYNIACGEAVTLTRLAEELRCQMGADVMPVHAPARVGDLRHSVADLTSAAADLGYAPRVGLVEGLGHTVAHFAAGAAAISVSP